MPRRRGRRRISNFLRFSFLHLIRLQVKCCETRGRRRECVWVLLFPSFLANAHFPLDSSPSPLKKSVLPEGGKDRFHSVPLSSLWVSGLEVFLILSPGSCLGFASSLRDKYLWLSLKFPQAIQVCRGVLPYQEDGFTTRHFRDHIWEFSQPAQGMMGFFPWLFS